VPSHLSTIGLWPLDDAKGFRERGLLDFVTAMISRGTILERRPDPPREVVLFEYFDLSGAGVVGVAKLTADGRAMELGHLCPTFRSSSPLHGVTIRWQVESKLRGSGVLRFPLRDLSREPTSESLPDSLRHLRPGWLPLAIELDDPALLADLRHAGRPATGSQEADVTLTGFVESMSVWSSADEFTGLGIAQPGTATFEDCLLTWHADQVEFAYPMGLREHPAEPRLEVSGVVQAAERRRNSVSGWDFDWARLSTPFGPFEVVIPALDPTPVPGQVLLADCRLVGRLAL
jgi:hypothetical protein